MSKLTVLVDMDEVIVNLVDSWLDMYHQLGGERKTREDIKSYSMDGQFRDMALFWKAIDRAPAMRIAKPLPGAIEGLRRLYETHDTFIVTYARTESWGKAHEAKLAWLWQHAPWFDRDKVIFARHKHLVRGDVLVEDNPQTIARWLDQERRVWAYLIDQPWNRGERTYFVDRVNSLSDVADALCGGEI